MGKELKQIGSIEELLEGDRVKVVLTDPGARPTVMTLVYEGRILGKEAFLLPTDVEGCLISFRAEEDSIRLSGGNVYLSSLRMTHMSYPFQSKQYQRKVALLQ